MKDLIFSLVIDALVLGSFWAWKVGGLASAGTFFVVLMWVFTGMMGVAALSSRKLPKRSGFLSSLRWLKGCVITACIVAACIYAGLVALAVCHAVAWMLLHAKFTQSEAV